MLTAETSYQRVPATDLDAGMRVWNHGIVESVCERVGGYRFANGKPTRATRLDVTFEDGDTLAYDARETVLLEA